MSQVPRGSSCRTTSEAGPDSGESDSSGSAVTPSEALPPRGRLTRSVQRGGDSFSKVYNRSGGRLESRGRTPLAGIARVASELSAVGHKSPRKTRWVRSARLRNWDQSRDFSQGLVHRSHV